MIKRILSIALLGTIIISNSACNSSNGDFKKINGVEYKIIKDAPGKTAAVGDMLKVNVRMKVGKGTAKDSVMLDSRKSYGQPVPFQLQAPHFRGDMAAAMAMLSAGDSAIIRVPVDTIQKSTGGSQPLPPFIKHGDMLTYEISVVSVQPAAEVQKETQAKQQQMQAASAQQAQTDDKTLQDYFAKNKIKAQKTPSGLYYTIQSEGSGAQIHNSQSVSMIYTGKTLEGKVFDSNTPGSKHTDPLTFAVGRHQVIPGMDEGIALLKKGSKATLYIPSPMAYGAQSPSPDVPANSILIFEVNITDVKDGAANAGPGAPNGGGNGGNVGQ